MNRGGGGLVLSSEVAVAVHIAVTNIKHDFPFSFDYYTIITILLSS